MEVFHGNRHASRPAAVQSRLPDRMASCLPGLFAASIKNHIDMIKSCFYTLAMISRTAEYAIRAMVALRSHGAGAPMLAREISKQTGIPQNYLSKIMHSLGRAGLVSSVRGPGGGFQLRTPSQRVTTYEIVALFEDLGNRRRCFLGKDICSDEHSCSAHDQWKRVWAVYEEFLQKTTLTTLVSDVGVVKLKRKTRPAGRPRAQKTKLRS